MNNIPNPQVATFGLGEFIRAQRTYLGLSQRELAVTIPIDRRTLQRIENGTERCPAGFLDTMGNLVETFDREVDETIDVAERMVAGKVVSQPLADHLARMVDPGVLPSPTAAIHFNVQTDDDPAHVWTRAVIGRAAVESGLIVPEARPEELVTTHAGRLANT
jgi:transcriptional regulator with XRE-family HTH domain